MSVVDKVRSIRRRLGPHPVRRAAEAVRKYGIGEFIRRGAAKVRGTDRAQVVDGRRLIVTNESYYPEKKARSFKPRREVAFETAPSQDSITMLEIRTRASAKAVVHLQIMEGGQTIAKGSGRAPEGDGWTSVKFPPLYGVFGKLLRFVIRIEDENAGVLVSPDREKPGFAVDGGGSVACRIYGAEGGDPYQEWISWNDPSEDELRAQVASVQSSAAAICMEVNADTEAHIPAFLESLKNQTWKNLRAYMMCTAGNVEKCGLLADRAGVKAYCVNTQPGPSAMEKLLGAAHERFFVFVDPRDVLAPHAIYSVVRALEDGADLVYADEDIEDVSTGLRSRPFFKPDCSPYLLMSYNYIGTLIGLTREAAEQLRPADAYDLVLQAVDAAERIVHVPDVLYHVRYGDQTYIADARDAVNVEAALCRRGINGSVVYNTDSSRFDTSYDVPDPAPLISIIIPSHDGVDMLRECVTSILDRTTYPNYEIVIVENNSTQDDTFRYYSEIEKDPRVRVLTWNNPFNFAAINNWAAKQAEGELLLFLNNDTAVISPDWLERMAALCTQPDVGAVGAKLLYADDTVQHGGVIVRLGGLAAHAHYGEPSDSPGSFGRLQVPFDVSAVTGACVMVPKDVFQEVDGFDEDFVLAYNDVDLCLKIRELGLEILFEPRAELYHYESKTRGYEESPEQLERFRREQTLWIRKWGDKYKGDPFYNPNLRYDTCSFETAPEKRGSSVARLSKPFDDLAAGDPG